MEYIILIGNAFDEEQLHTALCQYKQLGGGKFICMTGWQKNSVVNGQWERQRRWLLDHGIKSDIIVCPTNLPWTRRAKVEKHARAVSIFDQMVVTDFLTSEVDGCQGELFFVGSAELEDLVMELARFLNIPQFPAIDRCEYHKTSTTLKSDAQHWVTQSLNVVRGHAQIYSRLIPRTAKAKRTKQWKWLEENCI